jgi:hypothetical protein
MIMKYRLFVFFLLVMALRTNAQQVIITEEPSISALMEKFINWNAEKDYVSGWRIQIINTDDRRLMEKNIAAFKNRYPYIGNVHWEQVSPYYKVKVGGFGSKIKAQAFLAEVRQYFPSSITVWEKIKESELLEKND